MKKLSALVSNRWFWIALTLLVWAIAVGSMTWSQWHTDDRWLPLSYGLGVLAAVALLWFGIEFSWRMLRKRRQAEFDRLIAAKEGIDDRRREWASWTADMRKQGIDRYELPFYLLVGEPQSGKSVMLQNSDLRFLFGQSKLSGPGGTRGCDWWFTEEAVILDLAGRLFTHEGGASDTAEWEAFLDLLAGYRPECPINGVMLVIPCDALTKDSPEVSKRKCDRIQDSLITLAAKLHAKFPVYLVLTKADKIFGFAETVYRLDATKREEMFGWSVDAESFDKPFEIQHFQSGFQELIERAKLMRATAMQTTKLPEGQGAIDRMYAFPAELEAIYPALENYIRRIFSDSNLMERLYFRGFYVTSGLQKGTPIAQACAELYAGPREADALDLAGIFVKSRAYFVKDLIRKRIFLERGLVSPTRKKVVRARRNALVAYGTVASIAILFALVAIGTYVSVSKYPVVYDDLWGRAGKRERTETADGSKLVPIVRESGVPSAPYYDADQLATIQADSGGDDVWLKTSLLEYVDPTPWSAKVPQVVKAMEGLERATDSSVHPISLSIGLFLSAGGNVETPIALLRSTYFDRVYLPTLRLAALESAAARIQKASSLDDAAAAARCATMLVDDEFVRQALWAGADSGLATLFRGGDAVPNEQRKNELLGALRSTDQGVLGFDHHHTQRLKDADEADEAQKSEKVPALETLSIAEERLQPELAAVLAALEQRCVQLASGAGPGVLELGADSDLAKCMKLRAAVHVAQDKAEEYTLGLRSALGRVQALAVARVQNDADYRDALKACTELAVADASLKAALKSTQDAAKDLALSLPVLAAELEKLTGPLGRLQARVPPARASERAAALTAWAELLAFLPNHPPTVQARGGAIAARSGQPSLGDWQIAADKASFVPRDPSMDLRARVISEHKDAALTNAHIDLAIESGRLAEAASNATAFDSVYEQVRAIAVKELGLALDEADETALEGFNPTDARREFRILSILRIHQLLSQVNPPRLKGLLDASASAAADGTAFRADDVRGEPSRRLIVLCDLCNGRTRRGPVDEQIAAALVAPLRRLLGAYAPALRDVADALKAERSTVRFDENCILRLEAIARSAPSLAPSDPLVTALKDVVHNWQDGIRKRLDLRSNATVSDADIGECATVASAMDKAPTLRDYAGVNWQSQLLEPLLQQIRTIKTSVNALVERQTELGTDVAGAPLERSPIKNRQAIIEAAANALRNAERAVRQSDEFARAASACKGLVDKHVLLTNDDDKRTIDLFVPKSANTQEASTSGRPVDQLATHLDTLSNSAHRGDLRMNDLFALKVWCDATTSATEGTKGWTVGDRVTRSVAKRLLPLIPQWIAGEYIEQFERFAWNDVSELPWGFDANTHWTGEDRSALNDWLTLMIRGAKTEGEFSLAGWISERRTQVPLLDSILDSANPIEFAEPKWKRRWARAADVRKFVDGMKKFLANARGTSEFVCALVVLPLPTELNFNVCRPCNATTTELYGTTQDKPLVCEFTGRSSSAERVCFGKEGNLYAFSIGSLWSVLEAAWKESGGELIPARKAFTVAVEVQPEQQALAVPKELEKLNVQVSFLEDLPRVPSSFTPSKD